MEKRTLLIVDDRDQSQEAEEIRMTLKGNVDLEVIQIKTSEPEFLDDDNNIDLSKLKAIIEDRIKGHHLDLAVTDYKLSDDKYNGLNIVDTLKSIRPKLKIILYSGTLSDVLKDIIGGDIKDTNIDDVVKAVSELWKYGLIDFISRSDYTNNVITYFKKNDSATLDDYFMRMLEKHSDMKVNDIYPPYKDKTLGEIKKLLESGPDPRATECMKEFVEQTIAYLVKVNEE